MHQRGWMGTFVVGEVSAESPPGPSLSSASGCTPEAGVTAESSAQENLLLMRLIDQQYTRTPIYGSRRVTAWLEREGYQISRKRVQRLMGQTGLKAIYPKPHLSMPATQHKVYPYLLIA